MNIFANVSDNDLIALCSEIYGYSYGNGNSDNLNQVKKLYKEIGDNYQFIMDFMDEILLEATRRFEKLVKVLILKRPERFIRMGD